MPYDDKENYCCKLERIPATLHRRASWRAAPRRAFDAWPGIKMFLLGTAFPSFPNSTLQRPAVLRDSEGRSVLEMSAAFTPAPLFHTRCSDVAATTA